MQKKLVLLLITGISSFSVLANTQNLNTIDPHLCRQPGFFRFSYDYIKMPQDIQNMGLLGINYFADLTPSFYSGIGMYGSTIGTQGGLFVFTLGGGWRQKLFSQIWSDIGLDIGGGGGRSSLVGGGLMLRPHAGLQYDFQNIRLGINYTYLAFPTGKIRSSQIGANLDIPFDFYFLKTPNECSYAFDSLKIPLGKYIYFYKDDFGFLLQAYKQHSGTLNNAGQVQDGTIGLVGAEFDHYLTNSTFLWLKGSGAFTGIPNGYMDILAGMGYRYTLGNSGFAIVPQIGAGAGGGGLVDTGGGVLLQPQLGLELPISKSLSARTSGGYLWSPKGQMGAYTITALLLYHLNVGTLKDYRTDITSQFFTIQDWRINIFNQFYLNPQRTFTTSTAPIYLLALQIDQLFNRYFFMCYQGSFAYAGYHAGGYATGMIGPGLQTPTFFRNSTRLFGEILVGAGGGGSLALGGGSLIQPVAGLHYKISNTIGLQASAGYLKALQNSLSTPVINAGITINFGTLNKV